MLVLFYVFRRLHFGVEAHFNAESTSHSTSFRKGQYSNNEHSFSSCTTPDNALRSTAQGMSLGYSHVAEQPPSSAAGAKSPGVND